MAIANRESAEQDHFDLLPFIAIMMCLLGTLLLVTITIAVINIGIGAGEGWFRNHASERTRLPSSSIGMASMRFGTVIVDSKE
jgi:hypothetical protein